jgi:hypothetical protein
MINAVERLKQATSVKSALLILAQCIDELDSRPTEPLFDEPIAWDTDTDTGTLVYQSDAKTGGGVVVQHQRHATDEQIAALREEINNTTDPDDLQALQAKLTLMLDDGGIGYIPQEDAAPSVLHYEGDRVVIDLPPASEERKHQREALARRMDLGANLNMDEEEAVRAYKLGGPLWLYYAGADGQKFIYTLPREWRLAMIEDVMQDAPREAHEMSRDILRYDDSEGHSTLEISLDNLFGIQGHNG